MTHTSQLRFLAAYLCGLLVWICPLAAAQAENLLSDAAWTERQIAPGVQLRQAEFEELFGGPQFVSVLEVDLDQAKIRFAASQQFGEQRMLLPELAEQAGAVAAVNGGFAHGGPAFANSGILKIDGNVFPFLKQEPEDLGFVGSAALGIDEQERWHFQLRPGESWPEDCEEVRHALAGGHPLILNGRIDARIEQENYAPREARHSALQHPRTAIGLTGGRVAILVAVDGRAPGRASGVTLRELATLMKTFGCENAINLDGGGSTTMWVHRQGVVNHPSDNRAFDSEGARRIRTAVIVMQP